MDHLPNDMLEEILIRVDVPDLALLRQVNRSLRDMISTPEFATSYNARHQATSWQMVQLLTKESPSIGLLLCRRLLGDERKYFMDLRRFFSSDGGTLSLVSASGSLVLFIYGFQDGSFCLSVLNLFTTQLHTIELPEPVDNENEFDEWQNIRFNIVPGFHIMGFYISNVIVVTTYDDGIIFTPPRHRRYRFPEHIWETSVARQLLEGENLIPYNNTDGILLMRLPNGYLVSSQGGEVVYRNRLVDDLLLPALIQAQQHLIAPQDGWASFNNEYHGRHGWAISAQHLTHPTFEEGITCIGRINLFRMNEDWSSYVYVSTFEGLPTLALDYTQEPYLEQSGTIVHLTYTTTTNGNPHSKANHADWGLDQTEWGFVMFSYDISNPGWSYQVFPLPPGLVYVEGPVVTPALKIGRF